MRRLTVLALAIALAAPATAGASSRHGHHRHAARLGWAQAHRLALGQAHRLPVPGGVQTVKIDSCDRWSWWKIDCVVQADGQQTTSVADPCASIDASGNCVAGTDQQTTPTSCDVTIDVHKNSRTGRVWLTREPDLFCSS